MTNPHHQQGEEPNWAYQPPPIVPSADLPVRAPQQGWPAQPYEQTPTPATYQGGQYQPTPIPAWPPNSAQQPQYPVQPQYPAPQVYMMPAPTINQQINVTTRVSGGRGPNHMLHALLTFFTCGLWAPVWIVVAIAGRRR